MINKQKDFSTVV